MSGAITHTLPMLQLVCNLVIVDNSTTIPGEIQPPTTSPPAALPSNYVAYPEFGAAYKVVNELVTWHVASRRCAAERAYLAAIDSHKKIQAVRLQQPSMANRHVGLHLLESTKVWYNLQAGLSVEQAALPWGSGQPSGTGRCLIIPHDNLALNRSLCTVVGDFVCEIPYSAEDQSIDVTSRSIELFPEAKKKSE